MSNSGYYSSDVRKIAEVAQSCVIVHRFVRESNYGAIPKGEAVDHKIENELYNSPSYSRILIGSCL